MTSLFEQVYRYLLQPVTCCEFSFKYSKSLRNFVIYVRLNYRIQLQRQTVVLWYSIF